MILKNSMLLGAAVWMLVACSGGSQSESASEVSSEPSEPEETEMTAEVTQQMEVGKTVYNQYCMACHQTNGQGVPGAFPTLVQTEWVTGENTALITVIINGLQGEITVKGETYNSVMPQHGFLTDEQIAGVLTYVRQSFTNDSPAISVEEVTEVRQSLGDGQGS